MELRGYDSYQISLGDEMRGERASMGKSLADAEKDMRIKTRIITAIEECDLDGFPNQSVISGYVRSYARYLGLDADVVYRRFCDESGYRSPSAAAVETGGFPVQSGGTDGTLTPFGRSRFAAPPPVHSFRPRVSLGALTSAGALICLIGALSYGGYSLLRDIQRVGFAPLPQAPNVVVDAPSIGSPNVDTASLPRPQASDYVGGGTLAEVVLPAELAGAQLTGRDGPISAIDPDDAGLFANPEPEPSPELFAEAFDPADDPTVRARGSNGELEALAGFVPGPTLVEGVVLLASEDAWIRVRGNDNAVVFEGILGAGDRFDIPQVVEAPTLRAGNAGGIFVVVDGVPYGPVGKRGRVAKAVSLRAEDIRNNMPQATAAQIQPEDPVAVQQRADARPIASQ